MEERGGTVYLVESRRLNFIARRLSARLAANPDHQNERRAFGSAAISMRITAVALIVLFATALVSAAGSSKKKMIYYGVGLPDTQYLRDHWREMEEMPFDGLGILVAIDRAEWQKGKKGASNQLGWQMMGTREFREEEFRETIRDLRSVHLQRFTDNFLPVALSTSVCATGLSWFDDARWRTVANNFRVLTKIAAEGHFKGLILDPEHYGYSLFSYDELRKQVDRPFEEYVAIARSRGRDVMRAIAREKRDVVLLSFYAYTMVETQTRARATKRPEDIQYSLLAAFYDGLLEAMPARARFVDGFEFAYGYKTRKPFVDAYARIHGSAALSSAVPDEYRKKVLAGFGLWIDKGNGFKYFTPEEFQHSLELALETSDRYVWIYGQIPRFFPPSDIPRAYIDAIAAARQRRTN